jgi:hypothetical protein
VMVGMLVMVVMLVIVVMVVIVVEGLSEAHGTSPLPSMRIRDRKARPSMATVPGTGTRL